MSIQKGNSRTFNISTDLDMNSNQINELADPTLAQDAATKNYVDTEIASAGSGANLAWDAGTSTVTSDTGTDATITVVDAINPGLMSVADKNKLDGVEANADVTDATNVNAAGAVMNSDTSTSSMSFVIDEDNMASDLATKVPTQQSVKAYADTKMSLNSGGTAWKGDNKRIQNVSTPTGTNDAANKGYVDSHTGTTNLSYTAAAGNGTVTSDTGSDATIPAATVTNAGLFLPAEKTKLTNIETLADVTDTANVSTTGAGARAHGLVRMSAGTPSLASNSLNVDSITDVAVGKLRFNFSGLGLTADAYTAVVSSLDTGGSVLWAFIAAMEATYVEVWIRDSTGALSDSWQGLSLVIYSNH
jgi:hypothetical protein